ncbi:MAG: four helix bundle protein [Candidatus Moranbacteria bacterium]|nr:four helix bundle protein [Candidatus Moranbacteria bacterium]
MFIKIIQQLRPPPNTISPLFQKAKTLYILWCEYHKILPKAHRFTLGQKIDNQIIDIIEKIAIANFLKPEEKIPYVQVIIKKIDLLKIFLMILWETKSIDDKQYISLSEKTNEIGRMSGGWLGKLISK